MAGWRVWIEDRPWLGSRALWAARNDGPHAADKLYATGFVFTPLKKGQDPTGIVKPLDEETTESRDDNITSFLQAVLDAAWKSGLRPQGFQDHTNELTAVRYHLQDMRALALSGAKHD